jgi:hypothetical protein
MRLLADNPSIDFLRREAKDVLESLRESQPSATLATAQQATAEEYGFRTWAELKAEVERRRQATPDAPPALAEGLSDAFGLGPVQAPMTPVRYEYMGRRWILETAGGRFVVSPVFDWIDDSQAELAVDLQERARAVGVRSPVSRRSPDGGLVRRVCDQSWRLYEWTDLGPSPVEPVAGAIAERVGAVLAAVHEVAPATDRPIQGQWVSATDRPSAEVWAGLRERARAAGCSWVDELIGLAPALEELSSIATEAVPETVVITHRNLQIGGVRLGPGDDIVLTHWDFTGPMVPAWELATTLLHWSNSAANPEAIRGLLRGYRERRGSVPALTLESFGPVITGWLTWVLHRAWEAADPDPSERRAFAERTLRETIDNPLSVAKLEAVVAAAG